VAHDGRAQPCRSLPPPATLPVSPPKLHRAQERSLLRWLNKPALQFGGWTLQLRNANAAADWAP